MIVIIIEYSASLLKLVLIGIYFQMFETKETHTHTHTLSLSLSLRLIYFKKSKGLITCYT